MLNPAVASEHLGSRKICFYSKLIHENELVFDIGANRGNRVQIFLDLGARVIAVEPQPSCARYLRAKFGARENLTIIEKALDRRTGISFMKISNNDTVSSMNAEWIRSAKASGRFDDSSWDREIEVQTTTLDELIALYGVPMFIKIDVEGHESNVLHGLNVPVPRLSFEYTPEFIRPTLECLELLVDLGEYMFNLSSGESMEMSLPNFVPKEEIVELLNELERRKGREESGDVYALMSSPW